jgi:hypothetical protein
MGYKLVGIFILAAGLVFAVLGINDVVHAFSTGRWNIAFMSSSFSIVFIICGIAMLRLAKKKLN